MKEKIEIYGFHQKRKHYIIYDKNNITVKNGSLITGFVTFSEMYQMCISMCLIFIKIISK